MNKFLSFLLFAMAADPLASQQADQQSAEAAAAQATNGLGVDLYRALAGAQGTTNLCLSPYSLAVALAMTAEGARDETAAEMLRVLHCAEVAPLATVHAAFAALARQLREGAGDPSPELLERIQQLRQQLDAANQQAGQLSADSKYDAANAAAINAQRLAVELNRLLPRVQRYDLRVANALWVERSFDLLPDYVTAIDRWYGTGGVHALDIAGNTEAARQTINGWVEDNTNRRIRDLIPARGLATDTRLVITNAVWFLGEWATPFSASATKENDFLLAGGQRTKVQLMRDSGRDSVPYAAFTGKGVFFETPREVPAGPGPQPVTYPDSAGFLMVELPYKGDQLAMVVLLPREPDGLPHLESMLTSASLAEWLGHLRPRAVDTALPRFKSSAAMDLAQPLQALGMRRAFVSPASPDGAQFGGMSAANDPARQLFIGGVRQQTWIEVDEKGTEAAAATAVMMAPGSAMPNRTMVAFTPVFRADRPFVYLIRDRRSGAILFLGRHVDPRA